MASEVKKTTAAHRGFRPSGLRTNVSGIFSGKFPPTVLLEPLNATSGPPKSLELFEKVKVGRHVSQKTEPSPFNGYFNSKVLSRNHAQIWYENDAVYVKDLKSSNGTYLNSVRLSKEGLESSPHQLNDGDTLEFGIDIPNDAGEALYRRVACKVRIKLSTSSPAGATHESLSGGQLGSSENVNLNNKRCNEKPFTIHNPIKQAPETILGGGVRPSDATSTQSAPAVSPVNLNASVTAIIPKTILGRLQDEAWLASQESDELVGILDTVTDLLTTHQMQIDQLREEEAKKIEKLTLELTQKDALYQRLEAVTSKREAQLIEESKLLLQQLSRQRQTNQKLLTENSNLYVALVQHCPVFSKHNRLEKVVGNCECQKTKARFYDTTIQRYEQELVKLLQTSLEVKGENEGLRSCLESLAARVEGLQLSVNAASTQPKFEGSDSF